MSDDMHQPGSLTFDGTEADAFTKWNTRPQPAPPEQTPCNCGYAAGYAGERPADHFEWCATKRRQPAPPEGEPDFKATFKMLERRYQATYVPGVIRDYMPWLVEQAYRLGLAARLTVEDAAHISRVTIASQTFTRLDVLGQKYAEALRALAAREAELAKADAFIADHFSDDDKIDDETWSETGRQAIKRHAARQQQKASAEMDKP